MASHMMDAASDKDVSTHPADAPWPAKGISPRCRSELSSTERTQLDELAFKYGSQPESYDILISAGSYLMTPCGNGVVSILPHRHVWHIPGGLLAPDDLKPRMLEWLKRIAAENRRTIAFYCVGPRDVQYFRDLKFEINKLGEEPYVDLGSVTWQGKDFEWVRRQTNFCQRAGLEVVEISDDASKHALADELVEILHEDLKWRTYSHPLCLLEGEFDPRNLYRRRLFLARHQETNRVEGFLACSPLRDGRGWAFETYRKRSDAPRGTVPYLFRKVIDQLQDEKVEEVSLCLVPGKGVAEDPYTEGHWLSKLALSMWYKRLNFLFNTQGQNYFKSRFRPRYIDRYICVTPVTTALSISSFLYKSGAYSPNLFNILRNLWGSWRQKVPQD